MKITCESCAAQHELDPPSWVLASGRPFRFRCSSCGHSQMVAPPTTLALPADSPLHGPTPANTTERVRSGVGGASKASVAPPRPPDPEPSREPSPEDHHVYLRQEDKVYLVKDWATLQRWIMERRVGRDDEVSEGGVHWEAVGGKPELGSFFLAIEQIEAAELAGLTSAATPVRPGRRTAAPSGLARLDDDTEGVPVGLPPLPTEDLDDSSDEGASAAAVPPSRLMSASTPQGAPAPWAPEGGPDGDAVPRARPAPTPEVLAGRAFPERSIQDGAIDDSQPDPTRAQAPSDDAASPSTADAPPAPLPDSPPPPDDALLQEDSLPLVDVGPHPAPASADLATPPSPDGPVRPTATPSAPPATPPETTNASEPARDDDDFDPDDPFGAFDTPPAAGPSLPPGPPPPRRGSALVLWLGTAALVAAVLAMLGWAVATGRLGSAQGPPRPTPVPIETVPAAPAAGSTITDAPDSQVLPADTDTDTDIADTDTDIADTDTDIADTDVADVADTDTDASADGQPEPTPAPPVAAAPQPPSQPTATPAPRPAPRPSAASITDRGFAQLDQRDFAAAAQTFREATSRDPQSARAHFGLGYALAELGRNDESTRALCRASTLNPGALKAEIDTVLRRTGQSCP